MISGESFPTSVFRLQVSERNVPKAIDAILKRQLLGFVVKQFASKEDCDRVAVNFVNSPFSMQRSDGVPGRTVGLSVFGLRPELYFKNVSHSRSHVYSLFEGCSHIPARLEDSLRKGLPTCLSLRPAQYGDQQFLTLRANEWTGTGNMALEYHEDASQLLLPEQSCLEISRTLLPVAVNLYCKTPTYGGQLLIANIIPDLQSKRKLGLEHTGYPYPICLLHSFSIIEVDIGQGDLVVFNGSFLHAVRMGSGGGRRLVLNQFLGQVDDCTVVSWC